MATEARIKITAQDDSAAAFRKAQANVQNLANSAAGLASAFGVGFSVAGIVAMAKATIDGLDALNDLKDATGASIENLSALEDIAARTGTSMDTVSASVIKFNKALADAKPNSDAAKALDAIGLSAQQLKALDPAEALLKTAVALQGFADDGNKARLTQELFGKSLKEVAPFLKDLAEKGQLVATVTSQQALEAEKFNKEIFALTKNSQDLARALTGPLVESLNSVIAKFREGSAAGQGFLENAASIYANNIRQFYGVAPKPLSTGGATGDFGPGAGGGRGSVNPELARPSVGSIPDRATKTAGSQADPLAEAKRYLDNLQKQLDKTKELTFQEQLLADIQAGRIKKLTPALRESLETAARELDVAKDLATQRKKDLTDGEERNRQAGQTAAEIAKTEAAYQQYINTLLDNTPTRQLEAQQKDVAALTAEFEKGVLSEQLYLEAVSARLGLASDKLKDAKTDAEDFNTTFAKGLEDVIFSGKRLVDVIKDMAVHALKVSFKGLQGGNEAGGSTGGGLLASLGGFFGGFFANGGDPPLNRVSIVGEKGPELFVPKVAGTIVPSGQIGGGSVVITINQTVGDLVTGAVLQKNNQALVRQIQAGIGRSQNYGGALS